MMRYQTAIRCDAPGCGRQVVLAGLWDEAYAYTPIKARGWAMASDGRALCPACLSKARAQGGIISARPRGKVAMPKKVYVD